MGGAVTGNEGNSKRPTDDDDGTGNICLDSHVSFEPMPGRGPEVSGDQRSQGKEKHESKDADNTVSNNHSVRPG